MRRNRIGVPIDYNLYINCIDRYKNIYGSFYRMRVINYNKYGISISINGKK